MSKLFYQIIFLLVILITGMGIGLFIVSNDKKQQFQMPVVPKFIELTPTPSLVFVASRADSALSSSSSGSPRVNSTVLPAEPAPNVEDVVQVSPDGTMQEVLQIATYKDKAKSYFLFVLPASESISNHKPIFTKTVDSSETLSIPYNTFSPDNKYIFIQDSKGAVNHFLLFHSDGSTFSDGSNFQDISDLFANYTSDYLLHDVTGWASNTLLILETTQNGSSSTSFWFDVTTHSFTPLSTQF